MRWLLGFAEMVCALLSLAAMLIALPYFALRHITEKLHDARVPTPEPESSSYSCTRCAQERDR